MRTTMHFGGVPVELEANLGTARFFQEFTGMNLMETSGRLAKSMKDLNIDRTKIADANDAKALAENKEIMANIDKLSAASSQMIEFAEKLAFVMNTQTKFGKQIEDIHKIRQELNDDSFLAWSLQFEPTAFTVQTYTNLMAFWREQSKTTSIAKNA